MQCSGSLFYRYLSYQLSRLVPFNYFISRLFTISWHASGIVYQFNSPFFSCRGVMIFVDKKNPYSMTDFCFLYLEFCFNRL